MDAVKYVKLSVRLRGELQWVFGLDWHFLLSLVLHTFELNRDQLVVPVRERKLAVTLG